MDITIERTDDGSDTLYIKELDEHYHSIKGAFTESQHIFIDCGLKQINKQYINIFEAGFGTGLNAILTLLNSSNKAISYTTIEKYPLPFDVMNEINYSTLFSETEFELLKKLHASQWNKEVLITDNFKLHKIQNDLTTFSFSDYYDLIYFDAFAPDKQPEMWTTEIFINLFNHLKKGGILVTYCAKGEIRRRLQQTGFYVERLAGPPHGKREILRAIK